MATTPHSRSRARREVDYPTGDGKPMAETDVHRDLMLELIGTLQDRHEADPDVYVSGNLLLFYEEGNRRRHVAPDVFVVRGVEKKLRDHYLTWLEGKGPDLVIELTSRSTRSEDVKKKLALYRDVLKVPEYVLFDPFEEYLRPSMQGFRRVEGRYDPILWVDGRLPSEVLGLHLERDGISLRLRDPATGLRLPTLKERADDERLRADDERLRAEAERLRADDEQQRAEAERLRADDEQQRAEAERQRAETERQRAETERVRADEADAEIARLRRELEALRRQAPEAG